MSGVVLDCVRMSAERVETLEAPVVVLNKMLERLLGSGNRFATVVRAVLDDSNRAWSSQFIDHVLERASLGTLHSLEEREGVRDRIVRWLRKSEGWEAAVVLQSEIGLWLQFEKVELVRHSMELLGCGCGMEEDEQALEQLTRGMVERMMGDASFKFLGEKGSAFLTLMMDRDAFRLLEEAVSSVVSSVASSVGYVAVVGRRKRSRKKGWGLLDALLGSLTGGDLEADPSRTQMKTFRAFAVNHSLCERVWDLMEERICDKRRFDVLITLFGRSLWSRNKKSWVAACMEAVYAMYVCARDMEATFKSPLEVRELSDSHREQIIEYLEAGLTESATGRGGRVLVAELRKPERKDLMFVSTVEGKAEVRLVCPVCTLAAEGDPDTVLPSSHAVGQKVATFDSLGNLVTSSTLRANLQRHLGSLSGVHERALSEEAGEEIQQRTLLLHGVCDEEGEGVSEGVGEERLQEMIEQHKRMIALSLCLALGSRDSPAGNVVDSIVGGDGGGPRKRKRGLGSQQ